MRVSPRPSWIRRSSPKEKQRPEAPGSFAKVMMGMLMTNTVLIWNIWRLKCMDKSLLHIRIFNHDYIFLMIVCLKGKKKASHHTQSEMNYCQKTWRNQDIQDPSGFFSLNLQSIEQNEATSRNPPLWVASSDVATWISTQVLNPNLKPLPGRPNMVNMGDLMLQTAV